MCDGSSVVHFPVKEVPDEKSKYNIMVVKVRELVYKQRRLLIIITCTVLLIVLDSVGCILIYIRN